MSAEIIPIDRSDTSMVKEEYTAAIQLWCQTRDTAEILTREEIGAMQGVARIDAQRKALILNLVHYYRKHERADVAPGVAAVITLLSDNEKGAASISQPTLAKLFGRSLSSIGDAIRRLKDDGIIISGRGRYPLTYPAIPRAVTRGYNHLTWLVSAACEHDEPVKLPAPPGDCQSTGPARGLDQSTGRTGGLKEVNPPVEAVSIHRPDRCLLHYKNSTTLNRAASVVAVEIATAIGTLPAAAVEPPKPPAITQPAKPSLHDLTDRMLDVGGKAFANPAGSMGLLTFSEQARWLADGCDIELDILPTIRARTAKAPPGSIRSWSYFTQAISDAKATRLTPMPAGVPRPASQRSFAQQKEDAERAALDRDVEEIRKRGPARPLYEQLPEELETFRQLRPIEL